MASVSRTPVKVTRRPALGVLASPATVAVVLLPESGESLLLGVGVDVGADEEGDDVEKGDPGLLGQELLGKSEGDGRSGPRDLHDGQQAGTDGGADLVEGAGTGDDGHAG